MIKKRRIIAAILITMLAVGYFIGWHTGLGRAVRGVSMVAVSNRSAEPLRNVRVFLEDSKGRQWDRHYEHLEQGLSVRCGVYTSDLIVRRIVYEQGQRI